MDFDFNLVLVPLTLIFLALWITDKTFLKQRKTRGKGNETAAVRWAYELLPILLVVLIVRSFLYEPYNIPSDSMVPTLKTGDFILVDKNDFGVRLPLTNTTIWDSGKPESGDVAVFRFPLDPSIYFIKRIIGVPGDTVSYDGKLLTINGTPAPREMADALEQIDDYSEVQIETLPNRSHLIRTLPGFDQSDRTADFIASQRGVNTPEGSWSITVPEGSYFAMGDNRDESQDSRFWGFVPENNLAGRAVLVWMHKKPGLHLPDFSKARMIR